jgi:hypothetical protein
LEKEFLAEITKDVAVLLLAVYFVGLIVVAAALLRLRDVT